MKKKRGLIFNCQIHSYNSLETFSVGYKKDAYFFCHKAIKCIINTDCIYVKGKFVYQHKDMHATISQVRLFLAICIQFIFKACIYGGGCVLSVFFPKMIMQNVIADIQLLFLNIILHIKCSFLTAKEHKQHAF